MATVVDQYTVKFGMDPDEFIRGQEKIFRAMQKLKADAKAEGQGFGAAVDAGVTRASGKLGLLGSMLGKGGMVGVAIGSLIYAGKILDDKLFDVARGVRQVGIDSKNFNTAASNLRNLQNAAELAGGSMEDANKTVGGLAGALFDLKFNGQMSDSLVMIQRLGVHLTDSYGRARDFNSVLLDTADALEKSKAAGRMNDSEGFFFAQQAGFTGGMAQLVNSGRKNVEDELARQSARTQINGGISKNATDWVRASTSLGQSVVSEAGLRGVDALGGKRADADALLEKSGRAAVDFLSDVSDKLDEFGKSVDEASKRVDSFLGVSAGSSSKAVSTASYIASGPVGWALGAPSFVSELFGGSPATTGLSRGIRNNNPLNLRAVGDQPHDDAGFRVFPSMSEGVAAADRQLGLYDKRGINTLEGIISTWAPPNENNTKQYIEQMSKATGWEAGHVVRPEERAQLEVAMARKESGATINIDEININAPNATDANGIASHIGAALTRQKLLTANAEVGGQ